ncbi:hypothetical protein SAMN06269250_0472 [Spirosoma fluviale]|uniref:Uncharacterized protein n=1 Tax=Spirosoma fluviale TaxID=1597977 RepID=A0A286F5H2_9BACT|nr:hypothetical protein SAMN06269250_0472 [Spirosoma fluviale]
MYNYLERIDFNKIYIFMSLARGYKYIHHFVFFLYI